MHCNGLPRVVKMWSVHVEWNVVGSQVKCIKRRFVYFFYYGTEYLLLSMHILMSLCTKECTLVPFVNSRCSYAVTAFVISSYFFSDT